MKDILWDNIKKSQENNTVCNHLKNMPEEFARSKLRQVLSPDEVFVFLEKLGIRKAEWERNLITT